LKKDIITNENEKGHGAIKIAPKESTGEHWSLYYLDKFEYLIKKKRFIPISKKYQLLINI
jgi:hypothetical protein